MVIEGSIVFISSTLFWVIISRTFRFYTYMCYLGLIGLSSTLTICFFIAGIIVKEKKDKTEGIKTRKYLSFGTMYIILGIYIFLLIILVDSPIGVPILGPSDMNVDIYGWPSLIYLISLPEVILVLSGVGLLVKKSRLWLLIGGFSLIVSLGLVQYWFGEINMVYEYMRFRY